MSAKRAENPPGRPAHFGVAIGMTRNLLQALPDPDSSRKAGELRGEACGAVMPVYSCVYLRVPGQPVYTCLAKSICQESEAGGVSPVGIQNLHPESH